MIILPHKEKFIQENFIVFSFKGNVENYFPDFNLFKKLNSTDQYYLAENYNWDDSVEILKRIIESSKCDKGTALLVFWMSEPGYYIEKSENEIPDYEKDTYLMLRRIVEKLNHNEFKKSCLKYNPKDREKEVDCSKLNAEWNIPEELKNPTTVFSIISLGFIRQKIWERQRKRKLAKRAKKRLKH